MQKAIDNSAQYGDEVGHKIVNPHFRAFKSAYKQNIDNLPCEKIELIAFMWRVSGALQKFEFEGCENIELNRKKKYISIDIGVPIRRWQNRSDQEIAEYLIESMKMGLEEMLARLAANKITCDAPAIRLMFADGAKRYLDTWRAPSASSVSS